MAVLGYWRTSLEEFYKWNGKDANPSTGSVNQMMGFNETKDTFRYTFPIIHKDSTCDCDDNMMPIIGTIIGQEQDIICKIDDQCPPVKIPKNLISREDYENLKWEPDAE